MRLTAIPTSRKLFSVKVTVPIAGPCPGNTADTVLPSSTKAQLPPFEHVVVQVATTAWLQSVPVHAEGHTHIDPVPVALNPHIPWTHVESHAGRVAAVVHVAPLQPTLQLHEVVL